MSRRKDQSSVSRSSPKQEAQARQEEENKQEDLGGTASMWTYPPSQNDEEFRELNQGSKSSSSISSTQEEKASITEEDCPPVKELTNSEYPPASADMTDGESLLAGNEESSPASTATLDIPSEKIESQSKIMSVSVISEREVCRLRVLHH